MAAHTCTRNDGRWRSPGHSSRRDEEEVTLGAVVPAAGLSRRMGREKVLLPFGQSTILETILETLTGQGVEDIVVVLRPDLPEAQQRVQKASARTVINPHPEEDMIVSIRLGIEALSPEVEAFYVWPADHPAVRGETLQTLAREVASGRVLIPCYRSRRGHPALVGRQLRAEIGRLELPGGLRELWRVHEAAVTDVAVDDPGVVLDLDTPEAYEEALQRSRESKPKSSQF